jgi:hypothetical protein
MYYRRRAAFSGYHHLSVPTEYLTQSRQRLLFVDLMRSVTNRSVLDSMTISCACYAAQFLEENRSDYTELKITIHYRPSIRERVSHM